MFSVADVKVGSSLVDIFTNQLVSLRDNRDLRLAVGENFANLRSGNLELWPADVSAGYVLGLPKLLSEVDSLFAEELARRLNNPAEVSLQQGRDWLVSSGNLRVGDLNFNRLLASVNEDSITVRLPEEILSWLGSIGSFKAVNQHAVQWVRDNGPTYADNLLVAAWNLARDRLVSVSLPSAFTLQVKDDAKFIPANLALRLAVGRFQYLKERPSRQALVQARNELVELRLRYDDQKRNKLDRDVSKGNFVAFWTGLKRVVESKVDKDEVVSAFNSIPMLAPGTSSSRTWGIEIEVVAADRTTRPRGWDERGDGSLEPADGGDCECGCDDCCDYDNHCGYDDCQGGETAEYVSPILNSFNSEGVRSLCRQLEGAPCNSTPGIHIHVGAGDLSASDVARLTVAYSAVAPFIWPLMHRSTKNYCRDISPENIQHWLNQTKRSFNSSDPAQVAYHQPDDRYHDLNLQSLRSHGTIEFRALGPIYDYEHIVRWAWFVREMVNVSKLRLPQATWTSVRSMADVVKILRTYGREQVPSGIYKLYTNGDALSVEADQEANSIIP